IPNAYVKQTSEAVLLYNGSKDHHGRVPQSEQRKNLLFYSHGYQLVIKASPGNAIFEISVSVKLVEGNAEVENFDLSQVSRIDRYAPWVSCLRDQLPDYRKFCICR
ncbi:unnamed protein product, partial [Protopolystoma xenopodis]